MTSLQDPPRLNLVDADRTMRVANAVEGLAAFLLHDFDAAIRAYARVTGSAEPLPASVHAVVVFGTLEACTAWIMARADKHGGAEATDEAAARLYIVAYTDGAARGAACGGADEQAARAAAAAGFTWCGGCILGRAGALARLTRSPRMGFWRRPVSQACDRVVGAARLGLSLSDAAAVTGAPGTPMVVCAQTAWPLSRTRVGSPRGRAPDR